jgi:prevent-host-death family protein
MEVGIRELRDNLSRYLERVRSGDELVVTDRGAAVARVVPIDGGRLIDHLVAEGKVKRAPRRDRAPLPERVVGTGTVSDLIDHQRR